MKPLLLTALLTLWTIQSFAQLDSFNLASYKLPDIKTQRLDFNLAGDGNRDYKRIIDNTGTQSNTASSDLSGSLGFVYSYFRNTLKYQGERTVSATLNQEYSSRPAGRGIPNSKNLYLYSNGYVNCINRSYLRNNTFIEYDLSLLGYSNRDAKMKTDGSSSGYMGRNLNIRLPLLFGMGRIEPINDARLAVYILEDLRMSGKLDKDVQEHEILELASRISEIKSKRFFDSRVKKIWEIETLDKFLQDANLISVADAGYFTRLNDNWLYAAGPERRSGQRLSMGIIPMGNFSQSGFFQRPDTTGTQPVSKFLSIAANVKHERATPVNLYWQTGHTLELGVLIGKEGYSGTIPASDEDVIGLITANIQYWVGWFPNTRTNAGLSARLESMCLPKISGKNIDQPSFELGIKPSVALGVNYYISPQVRVTVNYQVNYSYDMERISEILYPFYTMDSRQGFHQSFDFRVLYSLF